METLEGLTQLMKEATDSLNKVALIAEGGKGGDARITLELGSLQAKLDEFVGKGYEEVVRKNCELEAKLTELQARYGESYVEWNEERFRELQIKYDRLEESRKKSVEAWDKYLEKEVNLTKVALEAKEGLNVQKKSMIDELNIKLEAEEKWRRWAEDNLRSLRKDNEDLNKQLRDLEDGPSKGPTPLSPEEARLNVSIDALKIKVANSEKELGSCKEALSGLEGLCKTSLDIYKTFRDDAASKVETASQKYEDDKKTLEAEEDLLAAEKVKLGREDSVSSTASKSSSDSRTTDRTTSTDLTVPFLCSRCSEPI